MDHSKQLIARRSTTPSVYVGIILLDCPYMVSSSFENMYKYDAYSHVFPLTLTSCLSWDASPL